MIVIYGKRSFGRVDAHGGEHAQTSFVHIYYMPIIPVGSFWVTQDLGSGARGFTIPMSGKSVAAAYLRCWGPIAVIASLATGGVGGAVAGAMFAAASAWSWSLRSLRSATARRKSDFHMLAFGTRCEPSRMPEHLRLTLKHALDERWAKLGVGHSPDDVATQGAKSPAEAVVAYGLLALAAVDAPPAARAGAAHAAQRILDGSHETMPAIDGPYRDALPELAHAASLSDEDIANAADAAHSARAVYAPPATRARVPWSQPTRARMLFAAFVAVACFAGIAAGLRDLQPRPIRDAAELSVPRHGTSRYTVRCTGDLAHVGDFESGERAWVCPVGDTRLLVVGKVPSADGEHAPAGTELTGELHALSDANEYRWPEEVHDAPNVASSFLKVTSGSDARAVLGVVSLLGLAAVGFIGVWLRRWWRTRRAARA